MNKCFIKIFTITLIVTMIFSACQEDDTQRTVAQILCEHTWKPADRYMSVPDTNAVIQIEITECEQDDRLKHNLNGTFQYDEGDIKCNNENPDVSYGNWSLTNDDTRILYEQGTPDEYSVGIKVLTDSTFVINYDIDYAINDSMSVLVPVSFKYRATN